MVESKYKNEEKEKFLKKDESITDVELLSTEIEGRHFTIETQFENEEPILFIGGKKALSLGNFSVITGKQKAGKGFTISILVDGFLNGHPQADIIGSATLLRKRVVYIDTEQAGGHAKRLLNTVKKLGGSEDLIDGYWLRGYSPKKIVKAVDIIIKKYSDECCLFIIDGIRDLSSKGINDQEESTMIFGKLLDWTQEYKIHIIVVIHQNKADGNATGYLGGDMVKKGELTLSVSKDKKTMTHKIDPEDTRDAPLEPIFFQIDETVTPVFTDAPLVTNKKPEPINISLDKHKSILKEIFSDGKGKTAGDLLSKIQYHFDVGEAKAKKFREYWLHIKLIKDEGHGAKRHYMPVQENKLNL